MGVRRGGGCVLVVLSLAVVLAPAVARGAPFDFDTGNAPIEVVIPTVVPVIRSAVSPGANDATIVLRMTTIATNAWFDAIAPYHPTAVGVYSRLGRRPPAEGLTNRNRNIAILYASYRVLMSLLPDHAAAWRDMLLGVGLDPNDARTDPGTAVGIGNAAGNAVVAFREHDGMNQLGDEGGRTYNRRPYADYLGYEPVNTAFVLRDPSRWQPNIVTSGNGLFQIQRFVTPQLRVTRPYSFARPEPFRVPVPLDSRPHGPHGPRAHRCVGRPCVTTSSAAASLLAPGPMPFAILRSIQAFSAVSRLWGGVHFRAAITTARDLCRPIGDLAYRFVQSHIDGTAP